MFPSAVKRIIGYTLMSWIPAILWMAIIIVPSSMPGWFFEPIQRSLGYKDLSLIFSDPMAHFMEYVVLGVLLYNALRDTTFQRRSLDWLLFMVLLVGMVFAIFDEAHQFLIPQRGFQVMDLLVDFMGLISVCGYINMKMERSRW